MNESGLRCRVDWGCGLRKETGEGGNVQDATALGVLVAHPLKSKLGALRTMLSREEAERVEGGKAEKEGMMYGEYKGRNAEPRSRRNLSESEAPREQVNLGYGGTPHPCS